MDTNKSYRIYQNPSREFKAANPRHGVIHMFPIACCSRIHRVDVHNISQVLLLWGLANIIYVIRWLVEAASDAVDDELLASPLEDRFQVIKIVPCIEWFCRPLALVQRSSRLIMKT